MIKRLFTSLYLFSCVVIYGGCGGGADIQTPSSIAITGVKCVTENVDPSVRNTGDANATAFINFWIYFDADKTISADDVEIARIYYTWNNAEYYWDIDLKKYPELLNTADRYFGGWHRFSSNNVVDSDCIPITKMKAVIKLKDQKAVESEFTTPVPGIAQSSVYTITYTENNQYGVSTSPDWTPMVKRALISYLYPSAGTNSLELSFSINDTKAFDGQVFLYNSAGESVGQSSLNFRDPITRYFTNIINNGTAFHVDGSPNTIVLRDVDITFKSGYSFSDISLASVTLTDGEQFPVSTTIIASNRSISAMRAISKKCNVSTFAGSGSSGSVDGTGTTATFYYPSGIICDDFGNLYVADTENNKIRKITPSGIVSTFAGSGSIGSSNGSGTSASFYYPFGITIDNFGNLFVADTGNNSIRKITPSGIVSTFAGSGSSGSDDGSSTAASFKHPYGIAVDSSGNLYVADTENNKIRKITPSGLVSTFAGSGSIGSDDGSSTTASFNHPYGIAVDSSGNLYVADTGNNKIRKITPPGLVSTFAGSGSVGCVDNLGLKASFHVLLGITTDNAGNLFVVDVGNRKIRKISPFGFVSTLAGSGLEGSVDGSGENASFMFLFGITTDSGGNMYVTDVDSNKIRKITIVE